MLNHRVHTVEVGGSPDYYQEVTLTNLYVEYAFSGTLATITIINDSLSDPVDLSFDGATKQGTVKVQETLKLNVDHKSSVWIKGTTGGDVIRLFGWAEVSPSSSSATSAQPLVAVTSTFATAGTSSTTVLAANTARVEAVIVNDSDTTIYLFLGGTAVIGSGIRLNAQGGSYVETLYTGAITSICASASKNLTVVEKTSS